jgi:hypothetical protein
MTFKVPDSPFWRAYVRGAIERLSNRWVWDNDANELNRFDASWIATNIAVSERVGIMDLQFIAYATSQQSVPGSYSNNLFALQSAEFNRGSQFNTTSYQWTVQESGPYLVGGFVQFVSMPQATSAIARIKVKVNGTFVLSSGNINSNSDDVQQAQFELPCYLAAGDVVDFWIGHSAGTAKNTSSDPRTQRVWAYAL